MKNLKKQLKKRIAAFTMALAVFWGIFPYTGFTTVYAEEKASEEENGEERAFEEESEKETVSGGDSTADTHTVTFVKTGDGFISVGQGEWGNGCITVEAGTDLTISLLPAEGKQIAKVVINGIVQSPEAFVPLQDGSYQYTLSSINDDYIIEAVFSDVLTDAGMGIVITNQNGEAVIPDAENICYAEKFVISVPGKKIGIDAGAWWRYQQELVVSGSANLGVVFVRDENQWFGTGKKVVISPELRLIIDSGIPQFEGVEDEIWLTAESTSAHIFGKINEENPAYLVWSGEEWHTLPEIAQIPGENRVSLAEDGSFAINLAMQGEAKVYYLYAVDKAGHFSVKQVNLYRDNTIPVVTGISIEAPNTLNLFPYGNFGSSSLTLQVTANDAAIPNASGRAAGIKAIEVYAGNDSVPSYVKQVENPVSNDSSINIRVTVLAGDSEKFAELKELRIVAVDGAGNRSVEYRLNDAMAVMGASSSLLMLEDNKPVIVVTPQQASLYTDFDIAPHRYWYKDIPDIGYTVSDLYGNKMGSGLQEGKVFLNGVQIPKYDKNYVTAGYLATSQTERDTIRKEDLAFMQEGENIVRVGFIDRAGNEAYAEQAICLDTQAPKVSGFEAAAFITRPSGYYAGTEIQVTVSAEDVTQDKAGKTFLASGVKDITLIVNGEEYQTLPASDGRAVFTIPQNGLEEGERQVIKSIAAYAVDNVGNKSELCALNASNSNFAANRDLLIETVRPQITLEADAGYIGTGDAVYSNVDTTFTIYVSDNDSGIYSTVVSLNGTEMIEDVKTDKEKVTEDSYTVSTGAAGIGQTSTGRYTLSVTVTDNAGNTNTMTKEIYRDEEAPKITRFEMLSAGNIEAEGTDLFFDTTDYGYYFGENARIAVYATDGTGEQGSGIKEIRYYTVSADGIKSGEKAVKSEDGKSAVLIIPAGFKGQLYACAYDQLGNCDGYVSPNGVIVEGAEKHNAEEHILFGKPESAFRNKENQEVYAGDVEVEITVRDTFSGIQSVEWSVTAPNDSSANQSGKVVIDNMGKFTLDNSAGFSVVKTDKNLVTEVKKSIKITGNSNDIVLHVVMTDRAGNKSEKDITFGIDKTEPIIDIIFDNNTPDAEYTTMFREERTATITVLERNFNPDDIRIDIVNTEGEVPVISEWTTQENPDNPDETKNSATVIFSADGDYTVAVSGHDSAGNEAETVSAEAFTIDKTMPVITVTYNSEKAVSEKYYAETRTAVIRIEEHNFSEERVGIHSGGTLPSISGWHNEGDVHTATITFDADGLYRFDVNFTDMAGNEADTWAGAEFYVDKTSPLIEITGVEHFSANNGDVIPQISFSDDNFDAERVVIELTGANRGSVRPEGTFSGQENGQVFTFQNFPVEQSCDDIYTLTATVADRAGNEETAAITFSVNRFGSVYVFDNSLKEIEGKYIQEETDVKLTEVNVDALEHETIKVAVNENGVSRELTEGIDYTVTEVGGNGNWYRYDYVLNHSLFAGDGRYIVTLYSEDVAGNINENIDEDKKAEIRFGIDKTAPVVIPIDIEDNGQYAVDVKSATIAISDNLVLEEVKIIIDNEECEYEVDGDNYIFDIPSGKERKDIIISAQDAAGNTTFYNVEGILVTTNVFVRWYQNKPLFTLTVAAGALSLVVVTGLSVAHGSGSIRIKRKKR